MAYAFSYGCQLYVMMLMSNIFYLQKPISLSSNPTPRASRWHRALTIKSRFCSVERAELGLRLRLRFGLGLPLVKGLLDVF